MFPVLIPEETTTGQPQRPLGLKLLIIGLAMIFAAATAMMFSAGAGDSAALSLIMMFAVAMIGSGVVSLIMARTAPLQKQKTKRGLEGLDLYTVIDRLVDDLDDDEAAYLRRRLDERDAQQKDDLTLTVGEMLEQRARDRDSR